MISLKKRISLIFVFYFLIFPEVYSNTENLYQIELFSKKVEKEIVVGVFDAPPKVFLNNDGNPDGFMIDLIKKIATENNLKIKYKYGTVSQMMDYLLSGEIDLYPGMTYTKERASIYTFNDISVIESWIEVYSTKESNINSISDLDKKKIGVVKSTYSSEYVNSKFKENFSFENEIIVFDNWDLMFSSLINKKVDVIVVDWFTVQSSNYKNVIVPTGIILRPIEIFLAFPKDINPQLVKLFDSSLEDLKNNPKSEYHKFMYKWLDKHYFNVIPKYIFIVIIVILCALLIVFVFVLLLRHKIKIKTKQLMKNNDELLVAINNLEKSEESLRLSENIKSKMVANIGDVIIIFDEFGLIKFVSPNVQKWFGWEAESLNGNDLSKQIYNEDLVLFNKFVGDLLGTYKMTRTNEIRFICKNGEIKTIEFTAVNLLFDIDIRGLLGNFHDITEKKIAEQILEKKEVQYRTLFDLSPNGIVLLDLNGNIIDVNVAYCETTSYEKVELIGKNIKSLYPNIDKKIIDKNIEQLKQGALLKHIVSNKKKDNTICMLELHETSVNLPDGSLGILSVSSDITDRLRAEEELKILAAALKSINECVSITDSENNIIFVNNSFIETYGYEKGDLIGKKISVVGSERNQGESRSKILNDTIKGGWKGKLYNRKKDGTEFPIFLSTTSVDDNNGKILGLIGIAKDITEDEKKEAELLKAKEKAEESDRLKSAFLANMSHEIRTPMNGILGFIELLKENDVDEKTRDEYIEIIENSGSRMLNIINDIIDISKIESGQMKIKLQETNVVDQIKFIGSLFTPEIEKKGLKIIINTDINSHYEVIKTDNEKLYAILTNLIKNAIKFTNSGFIEVGCSFNDFHEDIEHDSKYIGQLEFYVKDSGIGISDEHKEIIFMRFRQVSESLSRNYEGAGLGLAISKAFVEMLGGKIWIESELGKGSVFYFTIPIKNTIEKLNVKEEDNKGDQNSKLKNLKVLVVDDEENSRNLISMILKKFVIELLHAKNGKEAVEICKKRSDLDLILMDIKMPEMDGYEAIQLIRTFNKNHYCPIKI